MRYPREALVWRFVILSLVLTTGVFPGPAYTQTNGEQSLEGFMKGLRANAVQGQVIYQRKDGKFDVDAGMKLEEGDLIKTGSSSYAELLLQPGNYLRLGSETEFQVFSDDHDKMRLKLNEGTINVEILSREFGNFTNFYYTRAQVYELIRIITPGAEVYITQTGIFRIAAMPGGRTELLVREGEAVINGHRVKKKRRAVCYNNDVNITEINTKTEDAFDLWGRERAKHLVEANRSLKKEEAWAKKRKDGEETTVDLDETEEQEKQTASVYVVSAKPGSVNFVENGVEFNRPSKDWETLTEKSQLQAGDKLRTLDHSFVELSVLPDIHLRVKGNSEVSFEQLSYESITIKLTRGSAILDVARFDRKQVPQITFAGSATSVVIAEDGNYRIDVKPNDDEILVREGKVHLKERSVGSCNKITVAAVYDCASKRTDNFDFWSEHRGEGQIFTGRQYMSMVNHLARIRRTRFKNGGFWFQNPGKTHYTFVPFTSTYFRSPYGGTYSTVLTTRRPTIRRMDVGNPFPTRFPAPQVTRPRP